MRYMKDRIVKINYLTSKFLGHGTANNLLEALKEEIYKENMDKNA